MSWQAYVDDHLLCELPKGGVLSHAAIIGQDGGVWAQSPGFPALHDGEVQIVSALVHLMAPVVHHADMLMRLECRGACTSLEPLHLGQHVAVAVLLCFALCLLQSDVVTGVPRVHRRVQLLVTSWKLLKRWCISSGPVASHSCL